MGIFSKNEKTQATLEMEKFIDQVIAELEMLPQFIGKGHKVLNGLSGCVVSRKKGWLSLDWVSTSDGAYGRQEILSGREAIEKYVRLMKLQAGALTAK